MNAITGILAALSASFSLSNQKTSLAPKKKPKKATKEKRAQRKEKKRARRVNR